MLHSLLTQVSPYHSYGRMPTSNFVKETTHRLLKFKCSLLMSVHSGGWVMNINYQLILFRNVFKGDRVSGCHKYRVLRPRRRITGRTGWTATLIKWEGSICGIPCVGKTDERLAGWRQWAQSSSQFVSNTREVHLFGRLGYVSQQRLRPDRSR